MLQDKWLSAAQNMLAVNHQMLYTDSTLMSMLALAEACVSPIERLVIAIHDSAHCLLGTTYKHYLSKQAVPNSCRYKHICTVKNDRNHLMLPKDAIGSVSCKLVLAQN